jgi:hypothetical protein
LLCVNCNVRLGQFEDDPQVRHAAAYYVQFPTIRQHIRAEPDAARTGPAAREPRR